jgi:hypothetical protein
MAKRSCALVAAAALCAASAAAQTPTSPTSDSIRSFSADYFDPVHPADAYDMVRKLPGFEIIEGDEEVRGFTGSRGNVLFDGRVPSGKQESLEQMLRRIPAASVLRIELIRGGSQSASTGSYDLIANVIRKPVSASTTASILGGLAAADEVGLKPVLRLELTRERDERRLDISAALDVDIDDDSGRGAIVERSVDGEVIGRQQRDEREFERSLSADAEYKFPIGEAQIVANGSLARTRSSERVASRDGAFSTEVATNRERRWDGEAGLQSSLSRGSGQLEALVSYRFGWVKADAEEEEESFTEKTRTVETIARLEYRRGTERLQGFASIEGSLNTLAGDAELKVDGIPVFLSGSDVEVKERRGEGALGAAWKPSDAITVEPSLRAEMSRIRSTGDSEQDQSFLFWKPRLRVSWSKGTNRLTLTAEREAAQLDFGDFVASVELDRDDVTAGAASLRPPTTWSFTATYERRFWDSGALLVTARQEWISDVIDRVVLESGGELFDAVGNIGSGTRQSLKAELTLPLDRLGLFGMQVRANATWLRSRVEDPITGDRRVISEDRPFEGEVRLIHDVAGGKWSWGVDASFAHHEREFRLDEERLERKGTAVGAYVEFRPRRDWRLRLEAENIISRALVDTREHYNESRASGDIETIETRRLRTAPIATFTARKSFGGGSD